MFKLACKIPPKIEVALSGGPDSVALLGFLANSHRDVTAAFVHHGTKTSDESLKVVKKLCNQLGVPLRWSTFHGVKQQDKGLESNWRDMRYDFLDKAERPVVTAHHLDDAVEWWIFSSLHGTGKLIPRIRSNY